jgi:hypothetical protein
MTTNLHAHVNTASADCDGPHYSDYVVSLTDEEVAEHENAGGINDFHDLHFKSRVLDHIVSTHAEGGVLKVDPSGLDWHEPQDEGYRAACVTWCEDEGCDPNARGQRDVYAEQMGY